MGVKDRIVKRFFGATIDAQVKERLKAGSLSSPRVEEAQWRRLTTSAERDLVPASQDRMIEIAYWLWETNPLAGWLIDITTAFIMAEDLPYESKDEEVKDVLDGFWNDPVNRMDLYFSKHVSELHIFGELCFPAFVAQQTGRVRLGYVDPAQIDCVITDPENVKLQIGVLTKRYVGDIGGIHVEGEPKKYRIIQPEEADYVISPAGRQLRSQMTDGECFFFSINNVTNSPRGRSSLLSVADWLDAYEQFLFDYADKWPLQGSFVWDLLVTGGQPADIDEQIKKFSKKSGSVYGHNEKVVLTPATPALNAIDAQEGARLFRNHIMGRFGYPEHWYGGGGDVNRATASEMDLPAMKMLQNKQNYIWFMLNTILQYQVDQARQSGYLRSDGDFSVTTPPIQPKDVTKYGSMVQQVGAALVGAETQGWVDKETAQKLFAAIVAFVGVEIDLDEVRANVEKEQADNANQDYLKDKDGVMGNRQEAIGGRLRSIGKRL